MNLAESNIANYSREVAAKRKKGAWGGKRLGAGRKSTLSDPVSFTGDLERPDAEALEAIARERGVSVSSLVRRAVSAYVKRQKRKG